MQDHAQKIFAEMDEFSKQFRSMRDIPVREFNNQITRIPEPVVLGLCFTALPEFAARAYRDQKGIKILMPPKAAKDPIFTPAAT